MSGRRSQTNQTREARLRHFASQVNDASLNASVPPVPPPSQRSQIPDSSYVREIQAQLDAQLASNLQTEANGNPKYDEIDRRMAEELQGHGPVDYEDDDRALAERLTAQDYTIHWHRGLPAQEHSRGQQRGYYEYDEDESSEDESDDEELRRALAISLRDTISPGAGNSGPSSARASQASQPVPQPQHQAAPSNPHPAAAPTPPLNSRVAAICMLSERADPATIADDEKDCNICATTFGERNDHGETEHPIRLLGCKHLFGNGCIHRWLRENTSCPQCRREYSDDLQDRTINPETQDEKFREAYDDAMRREDVIKGEAAGRPLPAEDENEDPFFAEPSMEQLQRHEEENLRLMQGLSLGSSGRRGSSVRRRSSPGRGPTQIQSGLPRGRAPALTGFGMGRPGRALSPQIPLYTEEIPRVTIFPWGSSEPGTNRGTTRSSPPVYGYGIQADPPPRFGPGFPWSNNPDYDDDGPPNFGLDLRPGTNCGNTRPSPSPTHGYERYTIQPPQGGYTSHPRTPQSQHGHSQRHHPQPRYERESLQTRYGPPNRYHSNHPGQSPQRYPVVQPMPTIETPHGSRSLTSQEYIELGIAFPSDPRSRALGGRGRR